MRDLLEEGELDRFLKDRGWNPGTPIPLVVPHEGIAFDVPMEIRMGTAAGLAMKNAHAQA